jgi:CMP-N,N'-diacetyllegionaminic acid synthase
VRVLYLITARGGSKGIPGKNLRRLGGLSLVGFKARAAKKAKHCTRLVISTDSTDIAEEASRHGVEVPFMRPAELASDTAKSADVIDHAMRHFEERGERYDAVMLLEPSSPFTRAEDFDGAHALMEKTKASAVVGMRRMEVSSVFVGPMDDDKGIRQIVRQMKQERGVLRQETRREYTMNGGLYLFGWDFFRTHRNIYHDEERTFGYEMPDLHSLEIDEPRDLALAEFLVEKNYVSLSHWQ